MKINKYNLTSILIIAAIVSTTFVLLIFKLGDIKHNVFNYIVYALFLFALITLSLIVYELINTRRLKKSLGRFIEQIKLGNYESKEKDIIKKYDFVNITDIQVELSQIVGQIQSDYKEQKRYIENVSHELMTPIAIIRGKLELLIQSPNIEKNDFKLINDILLKLDRLTRVNQSLVLLSKINHNQYNVQSKVSINDIINETLNLFEDQIRIDKLTIRKNITPDLYLNMNENLAYLLIKNVIKNAIIHNIEKGQIIITQKENSIMITNTGKIINTSTDKLFERFKVAIESEDSIGLGLSIIQKICEVSNIQISYSHHDGLHSVSLNFNFLQN
jgi:signal transduction histidine kinase